MKMDNLIKQAREVLQIEAEGILNLVDRVGEDFVKAVNIIYSARGRVVVTGIGKSGLIGRKIVATLNSTGTPSIFLHPVEAMHGDLGMLVGSDVVLALSNSGETVELNAIIPAVKEMGASIIAMTGDMESTLAKLADTVLDVAVPREACPMGLAPTTSTTAALAMGDALAVALINSRRFNSKDFKKLHPGGSLGERLAVQVREVMITGLKVPMVKSDAPMEEAVSVMNQSSLGVLLIVGSGNMLEGIYTDGDLRRSLDKSGRLPDVKIGQVMTRSAITITQERLAAEALEIMQEHEVTVLPIVDESGRVLGMIHLHDLLGKGKFRFNNLECAK